MSFTEITGEAYTVDLKERLRLESQERRWLRQFRAILLPELRRGVSLLDVGCATGYAYNSFKEFGMMYTGLDIEVEYLKVAAQWFCDTPEVNFVEQDITVSGSPQTAEIVICSAMLEHCPNLMPALGHLVDSTERILVLRTFLGEAEDIYSIPSPVSQYRETHRKYYNQYSFQEVLGYIEGRGFRTRVYRDEYTDSVPQFLDGAVRTFYIVHAEKC